MSQIETKDTWRDTRWTIIAVVLAAVVVLPLLGVWLAGYALQPYLEFPPRTTYVTHEPFSRPVFIACALGIFGITVPFIVRLMPQGDHGSPIARTGLTSDALRRISLPWWGWCGTAWTITAWILAWNRFEWLGALQLHTFTALWLGYIVTVNAVSYARTGRCMLLHQVHYFLSLFSLSAGFWWIFEYLNRFVQNWYYVGARDFTAGEYLLLASLPFSTVLPAVMGTMECLESFSGLSALRKQMWTMRENPVQPPGWFLVLSAGAGLTGIGLWPDYLFPLVWVAPLLMITGLELLSGYPTIFDGLSHGHWERIGIAAMAALVCGFFWEMWNLHSLAHWEYTIPFVDRFQIFEMPILGYAGYLPFGLECLAVVELVLGRRHSDGVTFCTADRPKLVPQCDSSMS